MRLNSCITGLRAPRLVLPPTSSAVNEKEEEREKRGYRSCRSKRLTLRGLAAYFAAEVREDWLLEVQLLVLAFITGLQDSAAYPDFRCFTSNQTGNTVLLAVGYADLLNPENYIVRNSWISLGCFMLGALILGQAANWIGPRRRLTCVLMSLIQMTFVVCTATIDYSDAEKKGLTSGELNHHFSWQNDGAGKPYSTAKLAGLGLLAFSNGVQVAMVKGLRVSEITAAKVTSTYVDLFMDPYLLALNNRSRDRRVLVLLALFGGSFAGAYAAVAYGLYFPILLSAIGKALVTVVFLFSRSDKSNETLPGEEGQEV